MFLGKGSLGKAVMGMVVEKIKGVVVGMKDAETEEPLKGEQPIATAVESAVTDEPVVAAMLDAMLDAFFTNIARMKSRRISPSTRNMLPTNLQLRHISLPGPNGTADTKI